MQRVALYLTSLRLYNFHPRDPRSKLHPKDPRRQTLQSENGNKSELPKFNEVMSEAAKAVADEWDNFTTSFQKK